mmetsp:Transcript_17672/g.23282  ORF Transcript_17672/g.23282 Transcript_17672/m.23282 type:complete len:191 (-) Transcript_17672:1236-1808(-)
MGLLGNIKINARTPELLVENNTERQPEESFLGTMDPNLIFRAQITRISEACPFSNDSLIISISRGECFWLRGGSGSGKTLTAMHLASVQEMPGVETSFLWGESIPVSERVGMLFQGAVLVDTLTVGENIALGLRSGVKKKSLDQKRNRRCLDCKHWWGCKSGIWRSILANSVEVCSDGLPLRNYYHRASD